MTIAVRTQTVNITTSTDGAYSTTFPAAGPLLLHVVYEAGGALTAGSDLTVTDTLTGMTLLSATNFGSTAEVVWTPRRLVTDAVTGSDSTSVFDYQAVNPVGCTVSISGSTSGTAVTGTMNFVFG